MGIQHSHVLLLHSSTLLNMNSSHYIMCEGIVSNPVEKPMFSTICHRQ